MMQRSVDQMRTHEPLELLKLLHVVLDDVRADDVKVVELLDRGAVVLDERIVVFVERAQIVGRPDGEPPSAAMRSAVSSAIASTSSTCGSSISCTAMKFGPATFQCAQAARRGAGACPASRRGRIPRPARIQSRSRPIIAGRLIEAPAFTTAARAFSMERSGWHGIQTRSLWMSI